MSGIAGALFFDQAFSVTVGLLVSYITGMLLLPVLYKLVYSSKLPAIIQSKKRKSHKEEKDSIAQRVYHKGIDWVFSHKILTLVIMLILSPACIVLFSVIKKEKMPDINQNEVMVHVDWNENIHIQENYDRNMKFFQEFESYTVENSGWWAAAVFAE